MIYKVIQSHYNYGDYVVGEFSDLADAQHCAVKCYEDDRSGLWEYLIYERQIDEE